MFKLLIKFLNTEELFGPSFLFLSLSRSSLRRNFDALRMWPLKVALNVKKASNVPRYQSFPP